jgi:micrococcal nuclease
MRKSWVYSFQLLLLFLVIAASSIFLVFQIMGAFESLSVPRQGIVSQTHGETLQLPTGTSMEFSGSIPESQETQQKITADSQTVTAYVNRVVDGDTIEVILAGKKEKVRLIGIDAPETVDPRRPVGCYGVEASKEMTSLVANKNVTLKTDSQSSDRDKYQRLLRYVYTENGDFINAEMIQKGYAFAYKVFPFDYLKDFSDDEKEARDSDLGLWDPNVCPYNK